jgi:hypothetical protein
MNKKSFRKEGGLIMKAKDRIIFAADNIESLEDLKNYLRLLSGRIGDIPRTVAGAEGIVCSPLETARVLEIYPACTIVNPGIRFAGSEVQDQKRVNTPGAAIAAGASYVVMGTEGRLTENQLVKNQLVECQHPFLFLGNKVLL